MTLKFNTGTMSKLFYINTDFFTRKLSNSWLHHYLQGQGRIVAAPIQTAWLVFFSSDFDFAKFTSVMK